MIKRFILIFVILFTTSTAYAVDPVILYTDILNGPNSGTNDGDGGCYLSIFGLNFGDIIGNVTVTIGGGEVSAYKYLGIGLGREDIQQLSVQLGSACVTGIISVTVGSAVSNLDHSFTVRSGNIYFVSLSGNDVGGTVNDITDPYRTPNYVRELGAFTAGDFIVVRAGTYDLDDGTNYLRYDRWISAQESGTETHPITMYGYPGETAITQHDANDKMFGSSGSQNISWWVLANFSSEVYTEQCAVILAGAAGSSQCPHTNGFMFDSRFINIDTQGGVVGGSASPIGLGLTRRVKLLGVRVHDTDQGTPGEAVSHPIYLLGEQSDNEVGWCQVSDVPTARAIIQVFNDGWEGYPGPCLDSIDNIEIHDCLIRDVIGQAILLGTGVVDAWVYSNVIHSTPIPQSNYDDIFALRSRNLNAYIYNNTVYVNPNDTGVGHILGFGPGSGSVMPNHVYLNNNIFYVLEAQDEYFQKNDLSWGDENITSNNNIWYGSDDGLPSFAGGSDVETDPLMTDPANDDWTLQTGSPGIGAGVDVTAIVELDYYGATWTLPMDIGAIKYSGVDAASPVLSSSVISSNGIRITLTFNENVTQDVGYNDSDWDVDCNITGSGITLTAVSGDGTTIHLYDLGSEVQSGEVCTIDYVGGTMKDDVDNLLVQIIADSVTNNSTQGADTTPPELSTSVIAINGTTIELTFDENVSQEIGYNDSDWDVDCSVTGDNITLTYVSGDTTTIHSYTLGSEVQIDETCNIDFNGNPNSMEDDAGNDLAAIVSDPVTNNSTKGSIIPPPNFLGSILNGGIK